MNTVIHQYVRNRKGQPIGVVVATDSAQVGWSLCKTKVGDVFNKQMGLQIAVGRAKTNPIKSQQDLSKVPATLRKTAYNFLTDRSVRYFKQDA